MPDEKLKNLPAEIDKLLSKKQESPMKAQVLKLRKDFEGYISGFKNAAAKDKPSDLTQARKSVEKLKEAEECFTVKETDVYTSYAARQIMSGERAWLRANSTDSKGIEKVMAFTDKVASALAKKEQATKRKANKGGGAASNYKKDRDDSLIGLVVGHIKSSLYGKDGEPIPLTKKKVKDELEKVAKGAKAIGGKAISGLSNAWAYGGNNDECDKLYDHGNKEFHPDKPKQK